MKRSRTRDIRSGPRGLATLAAAALVGSMATPVHASDSENALRGTSDRSASVEQWSGNHWDLSGRTIRRGEGWLVVRDARVRSEAGWEIRADYFVARVSPFGGVETWWARGEVRVVGDAPIYGVAPKAISFRPNRSVALVGGGEDAELLGDRWDLTGQRVAIDLQQRAATIFEVGSR